MVRNGMCEWMPNECGMDVVSNAERNAELNAAGKAEWKADAEWNGMRNGI